MSVPVKEINKDHKSDLDHFCCCLGPKNCKNEECVIRKEYFATQNLKPCPFCGGEASKSEGRTGDDRLFMYIECLSCEATATPLMWNERK